MEQKVIICDAEKCAGCRICEYVCAAVNEGKINPRLSRIRTIRIDPIFDLALTCRKCDHPECINVCARNAITQNPDTKLIEIDADKCDGCGYCVEACNFGVLTIGIDKQVSMVCDNCAKANDGKPSCVDYCPKEALEYVSIDKIKEKSVKDFHSKLQKEADKRKK